MPIPPAEIVWAPSLPILPCGTLQLLQISKAERRRFAQVNRCGKKACRGSDEDRCSGVWGGGSEPPSLTRIVFDLSVQLGMQLLQRANGRAIILGIMRQTEALHLIRAVLFVAAVAAIYLVAAKVTGMWEPW